jgi:Tfp pilus assembly protein PilO
VVFAALAAVVVLAAGWLLVVKPQKSKVTTLNNQTDAQNATNAQLLTQITALQSDQKALPQQQLALQKFSTEVPDTAAEPTLIRQLTTTAHQAGVDLISITPGTAAAVSASAPAATSTLGAAPAPSQSLYQLTVSLAIVGSYANVESFFSAVEKLPRAMLVTAFTLCPEVNAGLGTGCTGPSEPSNKVAPPNSVGATLSTSVFFTPTTTTASTSTTQTLTTPATAPAVGTTPAPSPSDTTGTTTATTS